MKQLQHLKVARVDDMAKTYIVEYENKMYRVHMVPEQIGKGNPGEITCTIERSQNNCIITQDMETLLRQHYSEGDEVNYKIEKVTNTYYYLKDKYGYTTYLDNKYKINPTITPSLLCRIKSINNKRTNVELVEKITLEKSQFTIGTDNVTALFSQHMDTSKAESITHLLLADEPLGSFDSECHKWIFSLCKEHGAGKEQLCDIRQACLAVLEDSDMLLRCSANEREALEERFTTLIEQTGYYICALEAVESNTEEEKIDRLLSKLQNTGYVFHPKEAFYIMMCMFLTKSMDSNGEEFISSMMPRIYKTLRSGNMSNWRRKPFKLVWIKLLEFFIQTLYHSQDKVQTDRQALDNMVQALALQFNLTDEDDALIDSTLNLAMLYRYCALVGVVDPLSMLNVAYYTLIGAIQEEPCAIDKTSDTSRMACIIASQIAAFTPDISTSMRYEGKDADILLDNTGVRIVPKELDPDKAYGQLPEFLEMWNNLQVELPTKPSAISKLNRRALKPYKQLWTDVRLRLQNSASKNEKKNKDTNLYIDEKANIIVTRQTAAETPTFECKVINHPDNVQAKGTIRMADIVGYATPAVGLFSFERNGKPLIFDAYVTEICPDGTYKFAAKENIDEFCDNYRYENLKYNDHVYCVVTGGNTLTPFFAVSEQGLSMSVSYSEDDTPIQMPKGTVIEATCLEAGKPGFMMAQFCRIAPEIRLTLADAFGTLMSKYSSPETYEEEDSSEIDSVTDMIDRPRIEELMNIIDSVASLDNDYIKAFNYLGYCKLIAHIIEDSKQELYYESKMALIELLYEFDINDGLSEELINRFHASNSELFTHHSALHHQFRKLQIVSYMGNDEHNRELCDLACDTSSPDLSELAQLVISYNFMQKTSMGAQALDVQEHIKELLKLQKKDNPKKDYGQETFTKEFKTSIVCPPDTMHPDLPRQTHKIMEEICAFLNADGGELYIGVDDKTHLERGIEEDLKHPAFGGSRDKYDTYVRNQINRMLVPGEEADHCIKTHFDEEAQLPVYVISIQPCPRPVSIEGVFYERRGTSSRHVSDEYRSTFISNRLQAASNIEKDQVEKVLESALPSETACAEKTEEKRDSMASKPLEYSTDISSIRTSIVRASRHSNDGMLEEDLPVFVNIFDNNTYSVTPDMQYGCLSLGIYDEERQGSLIVVYASGEISKIDMGELLKSQKWAQKSINNKSRIVFVSPAMPGDVLSILFHSRNSDYYRFISVENIDHGTFNTCMHPFYSGPIEEILECEIMPIIDRNQYRNILDIDTDKPGGDAKKSDGKKAERAIRLFRGE